MPTAGTGISPSSVPRRVVASERGVEQYHTAIENAVDVVFSDSTRRAQFIGCTPTGAQNDSCLRGFLQTLGLRAWRRPLEPVEIDRLLSVAATKDPSLFPEYVPTLQDAIVREMRGTWESLAFDDKTSALDLFSTTKVVVNAELATIYGLSATDLTSTTFVLRSLPADGPRVGILGELGFLSEFANQKEGSPTLRGKFMRESFMCSIVPPPPPDVTDPPANMPLTKRQRLEIHRINPACNACHGLMDPMGLPLETFDAIGRYRTTDHGLPIDPSGEFDGLPVTDARSLGQTMSTSVAVANCLVRRYYSYAIGHEERQQDQSVLNTLAASFQASGYKLRDLVLDIATNDAFTSVAPQP
jgi:hypothetical protein